MSDHKNNKQKTINPKRAYRLQAINYRPILNPKTKNTKQQITNNKSQTTPPYRLIAIDYELSSKLHLATENKEQQTVNRKP